MHARAEVGGLGVVLARVLEPLPVGEDDTAVGVGLVDDLRHGFGQFAEPASLARSTASCWWRSVMSRNTSTQPTTSPAADRIGAALSSMGRSVPSLAMRTVWFARPTMTPSFNARATGFSTGCRVVSLTMRNTASSGWPAASAFVQPGQGLGHGVQVGDAARRVGRDDGIPDAGERGAQPLPLFGSASPTAATRPAGRWPRRAVVRPASGPVAWRGSWRRPRRRPTRTSPSPARPVASVGANRCRGETNR